MKHNLAVIEIKALRKRGGHQERKAFRKDIEKLIAFRGRVGCYAAAFFLVFGKGVERVVGYIRELQGEGKETGAVRLLHHAKAGQSAVIVPIDEI